jgi:hypothetical protein
MVAAMCSIKGQSGAWVLYDKYGTHVEVGTSETCERPLYTTHMNVKVES